MFREEVKSARLVANPGCYPTSVQLPLMPLLKVPPCILFILIALAFQYIFYTTSLYMIRFYLIISILDSLCFDSQYFFYYTYFYTYTLDLDVSVHAVLLHGHAHMPQ